MKMDGCECNRKFWIKVNCNDYCSKMVYIEKLGLARQLAEALANVLRLNLG